MNANSERFKSHRRRISRQIKELGTLPKGIFSTQEAAESYPDFYDQAAYEYDSSIQHVFRDRERKLISGLRCAARRIEIGEFGVCEECGARIPDKRLRANPLATLCIGCKENEEKRLLRKKT